MRASGCTCLVVALAACGGGGGDGDGKKKVDGDAAPVVVVERRGGGRPLPGEREPNNVDDQANPVALAAGARGSLDGETDVDVYRLELKERTVVEVRLTGTGVDLVLELHSRDQLLAHSDRGPAGAAEGLPNLPLDSGEYLLVVREFVKKPPTGKKKKKAPEEPPRVPRTGASPPYALTVQAAPAPQRGHEVEPNGQPAEAAELGLGEEGVGWLGWTEDVDLWRIDVTGLAAGYALDVELVVPEGAEAALALLDDNADPVVDRRGDRGETIAVRALVPREGNEHFTAKVTSKRSHPDEPYTLRATSRLLDLDAEQEPNDSSKTAGVLRDDPREEGGTRRGWVGAGDADYWRLPPGPSGALTVTVTPPAEVDVKVAVISGAPKAEAAAGKRGAPERLDGIAVTEREAVVLKVWGSGASTAPYELRWSLGPPAPALDPYAEPAEQ